jgi:hypothetical protein
MNDLSGPSSLPLRRTWLDDIVAVLLARPDGEAHVDTIANEMMKGTRDVGSTPEETITRRLNDFCADANDSDRRPRKVFFRRTAPGTYRLIGWPKAPNLVDVQDIEFSDPAYASTFKTYSDAMKKTLGKEWSAFRETLNKSYTTRAGI